MIPFMQHFLYDKILELEERGCQRKELGTGGWGREGRG